MLKHVSYRASSTSLSRPFGSSCRANTLSPQEKSHLPNSAIIGPISAPSSPLSTPHARHVRHHSITPNSDKYALDQAQQSALARTYRNTTGRKFTNKSFTFDRSDRVNEENLHNHEEQQTTTHQDGGEEEDAVSLKSDDPLCRHKKDLRSVESMTLRGELMPDLTPHADDTISLHSAISLNSLCHDNMRSSNTSLCSSASKVPVRIHLRQLRPDIEYKTLRLDADTSCRELIDHLLLKLRLKHRDPNLFAVVLEAAVRGPSGAPPLRKRFLLEDSAKPVELQQCRPRGEANFSITMRRGGVLRVRDSVLTPGSQYKSFLVSYTSTVVEVIRLLLRCNNRNDDWRIFTLHEVCSEPYSDRLLQDDDKPLDVQNSWAKNDKQNYSLVLRRHLTQGLIENRDTWRRLSIDDCSLDADVEVDEHNSTCSSIITTSSNSSRSRSSISSSTASVLSLASLSSSSSSRCSFSSNSSSGVSSGSSSSSSSSETPEKDRKPHRRQLPALPLTPTPAAKVFPISVEENIQSYFSIPSDDEHLTSTNYKTENMETVKRPVPLPRRMLSFPATIVSSYQSSDSGIDLSESKITHTKFTKSWSSACRSPTHWIKARGPTAQTWQNERCRSSRIRSATISTPIEHMANLSIYNRSKSTDQSRISTQTLTSQPSTPTLTSSNSSKTKFSFGLSSISRALSTSSINGPVTSYRQSIDHIVISPSTKLRPLSVYPNSCMAFPSRPSSLLSTHSQSTTTLKASSSSLNLATPSPESTKISFATSLTDSNAQSSLSKQSPPPSKILPQVILAIPKNSKQTTESLNTMKTINTSLNGKLCTEVSCKESNPAANCGDWSSEEQRQSQITDTNAESVKNPLTIIDTDTKHSSNNSHGEKKHCPSCCRYANCFYI
uniref:Serine-rich adhesin for platelets-like n=1 Tax=Hirondellea gigas TaxID=1518452 RepID=A0A2P2I8B1_9CRUS